MKVLLTSIGTRGDMEPFLAIAEKLKKRGHDVVCLFPEQFRPLAEDSGFRFESLGSEFIDLLHSPEGKAAMGGAGSGMAKLRAYAKLASLYTEINKKIIQRQYEVIERENPDRIVHNGKAVYPLIWGSKHPGQNILVSPVPYLIHPVKGHPHIGFNADLGPFNKLTYSIANYGLTKTVMKSVKWLGLKDKVTHADIRRRLRESQVIYTLSPSLFKRPDYWPVHAQVLGYHERNKTVNWEPSAELTQFMDKYQKILIVTFGSMDNPDPVGKTRIILDVLEKHRIPAIINTSSGGLTEPEEYDRELLHFVNHIPYDWAFPKVYGVVHHGGSGTTHMALKSGCASLIIPHIIDQFMWNQQLSEMGVGPKGRSIAKLKASDAERDIVDLWENAGYKEKAQGVAARMVKEELEDELIRAIIT